MTDSLKIVAAFDALVIVVCVLSGNFHWLLNTQVGFITATAVVYGSFFGYKKMINARVEAGDNSFQRDYLDKLEDPYDLDEPFEPSDETKEFKEILKEEKEALKNQKRTIAQVIRDSRASLSIYRLVSYAVLFVSFMVLNTKGALHVESYLFGVIAAPIVVIAATFYVKAKEG
jgi:hypothetical protein